MSIQDKIGRRIKELRIEKGLTQEAVAWRSELDRSFMNHVENGRRNLSVATLEKIICAGLEMSFQQFFMAESFSTTN